MTTKVMTVNTGIHVGGGGSVAAASSSRKRCMIGNDIPDCFVQIRLFAPYLFSSQLTKLFWSSYNFFLFFYCWFIL
jgi:hypothetical protein